MPKPDLTSSRPAATAHRPHRHGFLGADHIEDYSEEYQLTGIRGHGNSGSYLTEFGVRSLPYTVTPEICRYGVVIQASATGGRDHETACDDACEPVRAIA